MSDLKMLMERHPLIFRGEPPLVPSHIPEGWYGIVDELCAEIEVVLGGEHSKSFRVMQIKEKFGALRFYFTLGDSEDVYIDLHAPAGARTMIKKAKAGDAPELMDQLRALVEKASQRSLQTCMQCGEPGRLDDFKGWLAVLCELHAAERRAGGR